MVNIYPTIVDNPATFSLMLQGFTATNSSSNIPASIIVDISDVLLDSGAGLIGMPYKTTKSMARIANATLENTMGLYMIDCKAMNKTSIKYTFDFGHLDINVPLSELVSTPFGNNKCILGIQPVANQIVIGNAFLSSVYAVFDLDNYKISIAQAHWATSKTQTKHTITNIHPNGTIKDAIFVE